MIIFLRFVLLFVVTLGLYGGEQYKEYDVQSAIVTYEISGSDFMSNQSHLEIVGQATLLFNNWGVKSLYKEKYTQTTMGIMEDVQTFSSMVLDEGGDIFDVDFDKKVINTREDTIKKSAIGLRTDQYKSKMENLLSKGKNVGTSIVLGYLCEEWQIDELKECIYKGIVLKEEYFKDILRVKRAVKIEFDVAIHDELFLLPPYMRSESVGFLLDEKSVTIKKENTKPVEEKVSTQEVKVEKTPEVENKVKGEVAIDPSINKGLTAALFDKQKAFLPKFFDALQEARACIENAEVKDEANNCFEAINDLKEQLSGKAYKAYKVEYWLETDRDKKRNELDKEILILKQNMPCIRRSRNIDDLSECIDSKEFQ